MMRTLLALIMALSATAAWAKPPIDYVDPLVGTGRQGKTFPGATTPGGMVQLSPDTVTGGDNGSGYRYRDTTIQGFSFTHMSGVGWYGDLGNFLVMPTTGPLKTWYGECSKPFQNYGVWSATLPEGRNYSDAIETPWFREACRAAQVIPNQKEMEGKHLGFYTEFPTRAAETVTLKVGISFVSVEGARNNLKAEIPGLDFEKAFDRVRQKARQGWNEALGRMEVAGGTEEQKSAFYTAMYHARLDPRIFADVNGDYTGDEDCGQMSAWFLLAASGLHPACPGEPRYEIFTPLFDKVTLRLDPKYAKGKTFTIVAHNNSPQNLYIQSVTLNGKPLDRCWLSHQEITAGGILEMTLGPEPNKNWGGTSAR